MFIFRPFSVVEGEGFKALAKKLISLGAKYGENLSVNDALPCARTVSRHLQSVAEARKSALASDLSKLWSFAVTSDLWTHESTNTPYITVTIHYISSEWELCAHILATRAMEEKHTAQNIRSVIGGILQEFNASRPSNVFVTDNGANMKAAFKEETWVSCAGHNLNLAVTHALEGRHVEDSPQASIHSNAAITQLVATCKEIVTRVKRTHIQSQLPTTLKQVTNLTLTIYLLYTCYVAHTWHLYHKICNISDILLSVDKCRPITNI